MKNYLIATLLTFSVFLAAENSKPLLDLAHEKEFFENWTLSEESIGEKESFQEWLLTTENAQNFTRSFAIQKYILEEDYALKNFYNMFTEALSNDLKDQALNHEILLENNRHIVFTWSCNEPNAEIKKEWIHVQKGEDNQFIFTRFATKSSDLSSEDEVWKSMVTAVEENR